MEYNKQVKLIASLMCLSLITACASYTAENKLNPSLPPSENFDLSDWNISIPTDQDGNGRADTISETKLANGYVNDRFFYTGADGGMVFKAPVGGVKTSKNTKYVRVELREMLRRGDKQHSTKGVGKNNWVLGSYTGEDKQNAGAVDGVLTGTVAIENVTTTGNPKQVGRVVFAQIHAKKDVPIRFYYRKLPSNTKGSIYFSHEPSGKKDNYYELIGSRSSNTPDPIDDGIALGEKFSYKIQTKGNLLMVTLLVPGRKPITQTVDMSESGYDASGQYVYFKAGAYLQDNSADKEDYAQVVYYALDNRH